MARLRFGGLFCGLAVASLASPAWLEKASPEIAESGVTVLTFVAATEADEVLVVLSVRSEDGQNVLEFEDVIFAFDGSPRYGLTMIDHGLLDPERATRWILLEPGKQQYLQGLERSRFDLGEAKVELEFKPLLGRGRRHYSFRWEARVEKWSDVRRRYPQLPPIATAGSWRHEEVLFPRFAATK